MSLQFSYHYHKQQIGFLFWQGRQGLCKLAGISKSKQPVAGFLNGMELGYQYNFHFTFASDSEGISLKKSLLSAPYR